MSNNLSDLIKRITNLVHNIEEELEPYLEDNKISCFLERKRDDLAFFTSMVYNSKKQTISEMIKWIRKEGLESKWYGICQSPETYFAISEEISERIAYIDAERFKILKEEEQERRYDKDYAFEEKD